MKIVTIVKIGLVECRFLHCWIVVGPYNVFVFKVL